MTERSRDQGRRTVHERQAVVFGVMLATLAVTGLAAAAVFSGALHLSLFDRSFSTEPTTAAMKVPCPPEGALPVAADQITVNVLNASNRSGLASQTATGLTARGFVVGHTANSAEAVSGLAAITFGATGIAQAYTLQAHVQGAALQFDDARSDATVDLVLGSTFDTLTGLDKVGLDPAKPLARPPGCVSVADLVTPKPAG
jgi:hypothetical protein